MSSLTAESSADHDQALSISAMTDIELDSTGTGPTMAQPPAAESHQTNASEASLEAALGHVLVISGGSGYNDLVGATPSATYVMPISDNGGSSSEIIRVLGGPSIGDLRSRLNRLIPTPSGHIDSSAAAAACVTTSLPPPSNQAIHNLLSYRLPSHSGSREIKQEWMDILEGRHALWRGIEPERKEVIRGFLVHFESEVLRRAHRHFNFRGGSIGNFFLAAAQMFFRSIQSAIFLFSATTQISTSAMASKVLPVINTNHTATIAAELEDGEIIVGQCEISHPAPKVGKGAVMKGGSLTGPSLGAAWDAQRQHGLLSADQMHGLNEGGPSTPGFGPPAHYHVDPFTEVNDSLISGNVDVIDYDGSHFLAGSNQAAGSTRTTAVRPSPTNAQHVDARATLYAAQARKGLTKVGNQKDGLDPEDDDQDSQDGNDADSPRVNSAQDNHTSAPPSEPSRARKEKTGNIIFSKAEESSEPALPSPIRRILYVNAYRNEIYPAPNPSFVNALSRTQTLIYSCGSLYTSIVPCLCLRSIATSIAISPTLRFKVLLLNSVQDRETAGMDAVGFVSAICSALNQSDRSVEGHVWQPKQLVTHLVFFEDGQVKVDQQRLEAMGIRCVQAESRLRSKSGTPKFDEESVRQVLRKITQQV